MPCTDAQAAHRISTGSRMSPRNFGFIVSNGAEVPKDPKIRRFIRKQAMYDVAIARRERNQSLKASVCGTDEEKACNEAETVLQRPDSGTISSKQGELVGRRMSPKLLVPRTAYEVLRADYQIDIRDLAALTDFNISRSSVESLADLDRLQSILDRRICSYLDFVPERCNTSSCINLAVECVLAKLLSRLRADDGKAWARSMVMYSKTLSEVQKGIGNAGPDVLCAVSLLTIFELLDQRIEAWQHHVAGLSLLIRRSTVGVFRSDYEMSLLYAHLGPAITEAMEASEHCYLEAPEWQHLLLSYAQDSTWLTNRSLLTVRVRTSEAPLPGLISDVHDAYLNHTIYEEEAEALRQRCVQVRGDLDSCLSEYKNHLLRTALLYTPPSELAARREVFGSMLESYSIVTRLMAALHPDEVLQYQQETEGLVVQLEDLQRTPTGRDDWLFKGHELGVVKCLQLRAEMWRVPREAMAETEFRGLAHERWVVFYDSLRQWVR